jgi:hypothetical protein
VSRSTSFKVMGNCLPYTDHGLLVTDYGFLFVEYGLPVMGLLVPGFGERVTDNGLGYWLGVTG